MKHQAGAAAAVGTGAGADAAVGAGAGALRIQDIGPGLEGAQPVAALRESDPLAALSEPQSVERILDLTKMINTKRKK